MEIECQETFEKVSVPGLLFGLHWRADELVIARLNEVEARVVKEVIETREELQRELRELRELSQRQFATLFNAEQGKPESCCPNVFTLEPSDRSGWLERVVGQKMNLHLYCHAPGEWHPTVEGGRYEIDQPAAWLTKTAPYVHGLVKVLKYTSPLIAPGVGRVAADFEKMFSNQFKPMKKLVEKLRDIEDSRDYRNMDLDRDGEPGIRAYGAALRAIRQLLDEKDPRRGWGGLRRILTPEGHYLWLCDYHAQEYTR